MRFEYKHFAFIGPESQRAAEAAECANEQGQFWQYHDTLFANQRGENQGAFSAAALKNFAAALGLDTDAFNSCLDSGKYRNAVRADLEEAKGRDIKSTPTIVINGEVIPGALPFEQYQTLIEAALAGR